MHAIACFHCKHIAGVSQYALLSRAGPHDIVTSTKGEGFPKLLSCFCTNGFRARSPFFLALDVILLAGVLIHGLNGLRVALTGLGMGVQAHKVLFGALMFVATIALGVAVLKIFGS